MTLRPHPLNPLPWTFAGGRGGGQQGPCVEVAPHEEEEEHEDDEEEGEGEGNWKETTSSSELYNLAEQPPHPTSTSTLLPSPSTSAPTDTRKHQPQHTRPPSPNNFMETGYSTHGRRTGGNMLMNKETRMVSTAMDIMSAIQSSFAT
jgi:hypothetical protein